MTVVVFPDNTALINFAVIERMDLLASLAPNRAWCATVADECRRSSSLPGLSLMALAESIFGEPLRPENAVEHLTTRMYADRLRVPGDDRTKNLGEAETLAIIECRQVRALFVTDDIAVRDLVRADGSTTNCGATRGPYEMRVDINLRRGRSIKESSSRGYANSASELDLSLAELGLLLLQSGVAGNRVVAAAKQADLECLFHGKRQAGAVVPSVFEQSLRRCDGIW